MLKIDEVNAEIERLENKEMSYSTCEKLAWLYIVRDNITSVDMDDGVVDITVGNDFSSMLSRMSKENIIKVFNYCTERLKLILPKEYDNVVEEVKKYL